MAKGSEISIAPSRSTLTRRKLLRQAGVLVATGTILPQSRLFAEADSVSPAMRTLSEYMAVAGDHALPAEALQATKLHTLDTLAAMISGSQLPPGRAAIRFASAYKGEPVATIVASKLLCGPIEAALANAILAHSDETDDSHAPSQSHPGCSIVPAALASAERFDSDGQRFLRAVALGYDIGTRVSMTFGAVKYQTETHRSTHALAGLFGSAAAAACNAKLNHQQMRWVLDYTAQESAGIAAWQLDTEHIEKAFVFAGMPARNGVTAALLVQSGWTGVADIFSGPDNFLAAFAPQANPANLTEKLGERYEITRTNIKKWTVGSPIQAPLDALELIIKKHPFDVGQVQKVAVRVSTQEAAVVNNRTMPDICLQHMLAVMLIDKTVTFRSAHYEPRMQDPAVLTVRSKINLIPDEELDRLLPHRVAIVEVTLVNAAVFSERIDAVRGTSDNPMTEGEVVAKSRDLIDPVLGSLNGGKLVETMLKLEKIDTIHQLRLLLQKDES